MLRFKIMIEIVFFDKICKDAFMQKIIARKIERRYLE